MRYKVFVLALCFFSLCLPPVSADSGKVVFTLPGEGYEGSGQGLEGFVFWTYYEVPYIPGGSVGDYEIKVIGGVAGSGNVESHTVSNDGVWYKGYFNFYRELNAGANTVTVTITHPNGYSVSGSRNVTFTGGGGSGTGTKPEVGGYPEPEQSGMPWDPLPADWTLPNDFYTSNPSGWDKYVVLMHKISWGSKIFRIEAYPTGFFAEISESGRVDIWSNSPGSYTRYRWESGDGYNWTRSQVSGTTNMLYWVPSWYPDRVALLASSDDIYDLDGNLYFARTIYQGEDPGGGSGEPAINSKLVFLSPREGFVDNSQIFYFRAYYELPYYSGFLPSDIKLNISGGVQDYDYIVSPIDQNETEIKDGKIIGFLGFERAVNEGENTITVDLTVPSKGIFLSKSIKVTRLPGFIDEDGDGLDDRTGRPDGNYELGLGNNPQSALFIMLERKLGTSFLRSSLTAFTNLRSGVSEAPKIKIPIAEMFNAGASAFYSGANPFEGGKEYYIDFGYLDSVQFGGTSVMNYFRMLTSAGMVWFTFLYVWRKFVPDKAVV